MKKKIIITGGLGYIGTELCKLYSGVSWHHEIIVIDNRFISERVNQIRNWNMEFIQGDILDEGTGAFTTNKVLTSSIILNLSISTNIEILGTVIVIPILQAQDVIKTTNYFASGVGLIFSESLIEYELEDLSSLGIDLPIPSEDSSSATQNINTYQIGN